MKTKLMKHPLRTAVQNTDCYQRLKNPKPQWGLFGAKMPPKPNAGSIWKDETQIKRGNTTLRRTAT